MDGPSELGDTSLAAQCWVFIVSTLLITTLWVALLRNRSFSFLATAMFFPTIIAILVCLLLPTQSDGQQIWDVVHRAVSINERNAFSIGLSCSVATVYVLVVVAACVALNLVMRWAVPSEETTSKEAATHGHNRAVSGVRTRA